MPHPFFVTMLAGSVTLAWAASGMAAETTTPKTFWVYIGTYTGDASRGIYVAKLDVGTGTLSAPQLAAEVAQPSFVALHPTGKFLYSVNEIPGGKGGAITAFAIDRKTGLLTELNHEPSIGSGPCHLVVDKTGKTVLAANYGGGSVIALPIGEDGKVGPATGFVQHEGSSVNPARQKEPHAHSINVDSGNQFAFAADLGLDQVRIYKLNAAEGTIVPNEPAFAAVKPGAGPRHFAFHPNGKFAYVINEMGNTVTGFAYDAKTGALKVIDDVTTLPADFKGESYTAEVQITPNGKFLYGSNRGHDSLAIFKIDAATGKLTAAGHQSTLGKTPRNFTVDPTGTFVLAGNQGSGTIAVFRIDQETGALKAVGKPVAVGAPVCIKFLAAE